MMMAPTESVGVYLCTRPIDFRKGIHSLAVYIESELGESPFTQTLFLFTNRARNRVRILYWERNGFCLWSKVLMQGRFCWPQEGEQVQLSGQQLRWLLEGYDIRQLQPHAALEYDTLL